MKNSMIYVLAVGVMLPTGCMHPYKGYIKSFKKSLTCGLTVAQVEDLATINNARFDCQKPRGQELVCSAGWKREGVECVFGDRELLVAYRHLKIRPLTRVEILEKHALCHPERQ
jgi:hypothetical protein